MQRKSLIIIAIALAVTNVIIIAGACLYYFAFDTTKGSKHVNTFVDNYQDPDPKSGVKFTLEIRAENIVRNNAPEAVKNAPNFELAIETAATESRKSGNSFIDEFDKAFGNLSYRDKKALKEKFNSAVENDIRILDTRISNFGVRKYSIQRIGHSGHILVELPGVKELERVRELLQATASLEFWECYICNSDPDIVNAFNELNSNADLMADYTLKNNNHIFLGGAGASILHVSAADTAKVSEFFRDHRVISTLPKEFVAMWSSKADDNDLYELYAIKGSGKEKTAKLDGSVVTDARVQCDKSRPEVSMTMNSEGARKWAAITREAASEQRQIAIVFDNLVYSCPRVYGEITGGASSITGNFSYEEAEDFANILKSGKLDVPVRIIKQDAWGLTL